MGDSLHSFCSLVREFQTPWPLTHRGGKCVEHRLGAKAKASCNSYWTMSPTEVIGKVCIQAPEPLSIIAESLAHSFLSFASLSKPFAANEALISPSSFPLQHQNQVALNCDIQTTLKCFISKGIWHRVGGMVVV